jgi:branched-chain amino acid transport system permease protein
MVIAKSPEPLLFIELGTRVSWYYFSLAALTLAILASALVFRSDFGLRLEALRENEDLARAAGVNVARDKIVAFMVSGLFAGAAGAMLAYYQHFIGPHQFGSKAGIELILMLLVGGSSSLLGPIVGVIVVIALPGLLNLSPTQNEVALGIIFIAIILLLPRGLIGASGLTSARRQCAEKSPEAAS